MKAGCGDKTKTNCVTAADVTCGIVLDESKSGHTIQLSLLPIFAFRYVTSFHLHPLMFFLLIKMAGARKTSFALTDEQFHQSDHDRTQLAPTPIRHSAMVHKVPATTTLSSA